MIGKIQWNIIIWKIRFLFSLKYGKYYWCRLFACKKNLCKDFELKDLREYDDLYVQGDTLLLADYLRTLENVS